MEIKDLIGQFIATILRAVLGPALAWLLAKGYITADDNTQIIGLLAATAVIVIWGVVNKFLWGSKVETALKLPSNTTYEQLKNIITK